MGVAEGGGGYESPRPWAAAPTSKIFTDAISDYGDDAIQVTLIIRAGFGDDLAGPLIDARAYIEVLKADILFA